MTVSFCYIRYDFIDLFLIYQQAYYYIYVNWFWIEITQFWMSLGKRLDQYMISSRKKDVLIWNPFLNDMSDTLNPRL